MRVIVLLRGVIPVEKNRIPKMSYLAEIMEEVGFSEVKTYIQSGNILLNTDKTIAETARIVHETIKDKIGTDLSVIIKVKEDFEGEIAENPFDETYDYSRIHLVFTNDQMDTKKLTSVLEMDFDTEELKQGNHCLYMYLPKDTSKKKLNTNFLERKLGITGTMRKINIVQHLYDMA